MVGKEADVMGQQPGHSGLEPAGEAAIVTTPEQPMVHQDGVGSRLDGRVDQGQAGGHP